MAETSINLSEISAELAKTNTRMARLVLIFTIMTILYLPLGFVTVRLIPCIGLSVADVFYLRVSSA
jgi:hypothetical protein